MKQNDIAMKQYERNEIAMKQNNIAMKQYIRKK
jgi:hypothetical protein